ncbi:hypothetical protein CDD82_6159 [Ophiocordyceps australis]|uniref:Uncharacterized protein n=1 Tax=Ophiocordyceps australis TaxID=1399860 RepID=A0A2C5ZSI3_9HYPO|nr:hypothetical protein CDD82_6159 [Ophiocordyceps australis]
MVRTIFEDEVLLRTTREAVQRHWSVAHNRYDHNLWPANPLTDEARNHQPINLPRQDSGKGRGNTASWRRKRDHQIQQMPILDELDSIAARLGHPSPIKVSGSTRDNPIILETPPPSQPPEGQRSETQTAVETSSSKRIKTLEADMEVVRDELLQVKTQAELQAQSIDRDREDARQAVALMRHWVYELAVELDGKKHN